MPDPTKRFSDRVADYVAARPGYPVALIDNLRAAGALADGAIVADVGSGTGISTAMFLSAGCRVFAVEPNEAMRREAERRFAGRNGFVSIAGAAERTGLGDASVDLVAAGQAFHWFDADAAASEFARILKPDGWITLFWNTRDHEATPFMGELEDLIRRFGTDYAAVHHSNIDEESLRRFIPRDFQKCNATLDQLLDRAGLRARLGSASYLPARDTPEGSAMLAAADELFDRHALDARVTLRYRLDHYLGRP